MPYLVAITSGIFFYLLSVFLSVIFNELFINIAATFFAIPLLYFLYEKSRSYFHRRLNKEIFDYAKMQVDRELLSILNQLQKMVYTAKGKGLSKEAYKNFLSTGLEELRKQLKDNKYLGFQFLKIGQ